MSLALRPRENLGRTDKPPPAHPGRLVEECRIGAYRDDMQIVAGEAVSGKFFRKPPAD